MNIDVPVAAERCFYGLNETILIKQKTNNELDSFAIELHVSYILATRRVSQAKKQPVDDALHGGG